jgi:DNA-binding GntR family transcriptional regulator
MLTPLSHDSRRERVARELRHAIVSGDFEPGFRLIEIDLAAQLGTSRATVREAMRLLEQEGLIVTYPFRGSEVLGTSQDEIESVLVPIRLVLERFAFARALPRLGEGDFETLQGLVDDMAEATERGDADRVADADLEFHEHVIVAADQPHSLQVWRTILPRVRAYFRRDALAHSATDGVARQHAELLATLRSGDEAKVLDALDAHIRIFGHSEA